MNARLPATNQTNGSNREPIRSPEVLARQVAVPGPLPSNVLATIAHEFQTPLATMQVTLKVLDELGALPPEDAKQLVRRLQRSVNWLAGLVGNLEIWAAVENGRLTLNLAPVSVHEYAELALALVQPLLDLHRQTVHIVCPPVSPVVRGDSRLLCQVLVNLLMNASKYGQSADEIDLVITPTSGWVEIRVTDHGSGISEDEQAQIFDRYARGNTSARRTEGSGLGLHIVKTLVEMHGGTVGVDSVPAQGASFWFRLPLRSSADNERDESWLAHHEVA